MPYQELRRHNPWLLVLVTAMLLGDMGYYAFRLLQGGRENAVYKVVDLASLNVEPSFMGAMLAACCLMVIPNILCSLSNFKFCHRTASKCATIGFAFAAIVWMMLAWFVSRSESYQPWLLWLFGQRAIASMSLAAFMGSILNDSRRRQLVESQRYEKRFS